MKKENKKFIDFLIYSERLKAEYRHAHKSDGKPESSAEHSWRLSLMLLIVAPKLQKELDLLRTLKMAIVHDLVEIEAKDVPVLDHIANHELKALKDTEEEKAIQNIQNMLGEEGDEIHALFDEYHSGKTYEAKILNVLDKIEGQTQFLSEDVKKFSNAEQGPVAKLISKTADLAKIDPYLEQLYLDCGEMFRERTQPK
jgi:putative hydrolase of HD superfamily